MAYLELRAVDKRYRDQVALDGVSLAVEKGELLCLLGPSGCGKTTTLRIIAGFEHADQGGVFLDGTDIAPVPAQKRDIGVVFQSYALFPHLTVADNVGFGLRMRGIAPALIRQTVAEALSLVRLSGIGHRLPRQLSGGQQQRVALARAIAIKPRLLLLDEPLSNLDAKLREEMREEIRRIQRSVGITAIFVTHDQHEALALADRIVVMDHGHVVQIDTPARVYERPAHPFVASFFGRANSISGQVTATDSGTVRFRAANGAEFTGTGTGFVPGDRVVGVIKYERTQLARAPVKNTPNAVPGHVTGVTYLGTHVEYAIEANGLRLGAMQANESRSMPLGSGDAVAVIFPVEDCLVLRDG